MTRSPLSAALAGELRASLPDLLRDPEVAAALRDALAPALVAAAPAAPRSLSARDCARIYCGGEDSAALARWRVLRSDYPQIDERAALGPPGRLRRWDAATLEQVVTELRPQMRRRRLDRIADPR